MNKVEKFQRFLVFLAEQGITSFSTETILPVIRKYFLVDFKLASKYLKEMHIAGLLSYDGFKFIIEYHKKQ